MTEIRQATPDDIPALLPLVEAYWAYEGLCGFEPKRVAVQLERLLKGSPLGGGWVAWAGDRAVGYLLAVYVFSLEHLGITAEIDEFFVLPAQRGQGIGAALLRQAEAGVHLDGCTNVSLQLARNNHAARAFYLRHEFTERSGFELLEKDLL